MSNLPVTALYPQERLDKLAERIYGTKIADEIADAIRGLLKANPGLADYGFFIPGGTPVKNIPVIEPSVQSDILRPWE